MSEFKREGRYIVIKRSDLAKVPVSYRNTMINPMFNLLPHLPKRECVVVEADWPEYEPIWRMIERRVMGLPDELTVAQSELSALREENERLKSESFEELYNAAIDERDAMREELAERNEVITMKAREVLEAQTAVTDWAAKCKAAEQRNEELVKLLRIMAGDYARCLEAGYDRITFLGGDCDSVEKMLNDNPNYAKAISALKPTESGASE